MELKRNVLEVNVYGEPVQIRFPTFYETKIFGKEQKNDEFEAVLDFLQRLGLERKLSESMEIHHIKQIIDTLSSEKKS